jgi:hypothetical protein
MSDGLYKVATELAVGDIIKTIDIPNPFNVDNREETANYRITQSELEAGTTYSTNAITNIRRIDTYTKIVKITFTDGSDWFDNPLSNYLSVRNNEVRFLTLYGNGANEESITIGDNILLLDTSNIETPLFVLKEISNIEIVSEFFGGYEITVENAHLFLTKSDVDSDKSYVSIEHNLLSCSGEPTCVQANCAKGDICCNQPPFNMVCTKVTKCLGCTAEA